ncbi:MAG: hypothetical protein DDT32_01574 [Syntrophomonadaceae bacterium]|nr:hypothetical protein [Bacillota bacterium]MBT9147808.1 hypothetical protein [Bacillota bacterium]
MFSLDIQMFDLSLFVSLSIMSVAGVMSMINIMIFGRRMSKMKGKIERSIREGFSSEQIHKILPSPITSLEYFTTSFAAAAGIITVALSMLNNFLPILLILGLVMFTSSLVTIIQLCKTRLTGKPVMFPKAIRYYGSIYSLIGLIALGYLVGMVFL